MRAFSLQLPHFESVRTLKAPGPITSSPRRDDLAESLIPVRSIHLAIANP